MYNIYLSEQIDSKLSPSWHQTRSRVTNSMTFVSAISSC